RRELVKQTETPQLVQSATVDDTGVYVSYDTQLVRLDRKTLQVQTQAKMAFPAELQVVCGKYLAATGRRGEFERFSIPELRPVAPAIHSYALIPLGGRLDHQWMWDGVVWDAEMARPELLAYPALFALSPERVA